MAISRRLGIRITHPRTFDGNRPDIIPPLGVLFMLPLTAVWIVSCLALTLFSRRPMSEEIPLALFGSIAPIVSGYGISTNRVWSRPFLVITLAVSIVLVAVDGGISKNWRLDDSPLLIAAISIWLIVSAYLYFSRRARVFYLLIAGREIPSTLRDVTLEPSAWIVNLFSVLAAIAEWLLVVLALAIFFTIGFL